MLLASVWDNNKTVKGRGMDTFFAANLANDQEPDTLESTTEERMLTSEQSQAPLSGTRQLLPFPEQEMDFAELEAILDDV